MASWKVVGRRCRWVTESTISESVQPQPDGYWSPVRRFTATIRGWRNWKIWEGDIRQFRNDELCKMVIAKVEGIRDRIDAGDETVFAGAENRGLGQKEDLTPPPEGAIIPQRLSSKEFCGE